MVGNNGWVEEEKQQREGCKGIRKRGTWNKETEKGESMLELREGILEKKVRNVKRGD